MDVKTFATLLSKELNKRGISKELAVKHTVSLVRTFDEEDLKEIASYTSPSEFEELTDSLAGLILDDLREKSETKVIPVINTQKKAEEIHDPSATAEFVPIKPTNAEKATKSFATEEFTAIAKTTPRTEPSAMDGATREIPTLKAKMQDTSSQDAMKTKAFSLESTSTSIGAETIAFVANDSTTSAERTTVNIPITKQAAPETEQEIYLDEEYDNEKVALTKRGRKFFIGIIILTSPLLLLAAVTVLGFFALGILAVCALFATALLLVCTEAVLGSTVTLVGVIYGAICIVSGAMGEGLFEMGLGICCGAVFLCLGILTYNFASLVLPYVMKRLISFEGYCLKRLGPIVNRFREECNRL